MPVKSETRSGLAAEIKIVPAWAWILAGITFIGAQIAFYVVAQGFSPWARPFLGLVLALMLAIYVLFIGYINRDAKRRGMSPTLWTIVAVLIPNALGILLYFVLRQPQQSACPQCGNAVQTTFSFCPRCSYKLSPSCPQCQRATSVDDAYCPYCGTSLRNQSTVVKP